MKRKYVVPLAALGIVLAEPTFVAGKSVYDNLTPNKGIERVVQNSSGNELEKLLGGVAYGQSDGIDKKSQIDYDEIGKKAGNFLKPETFKTALEMMQPYQNDPGNKSGLFYAHLGLGYRYSGDFENAERFYKKALEINPSDESTRVNLGILYLRFMNTAESRKLAQEQFEYTIKNINKNNLAAITYLNGMKSGRF